MALAIDLLFVSGERFIGQPSVRGWERMRQGKEPPSTDRHNAIASLASKEEPACAGKRR